MTTQPIDPVAAAPAARADAPPPPWLRDVFTLAKVRVNTLVIATTAGGYWLGAAGASDPVMLFNVCLGTAMVAGGAAAMNQVYERDVDRLMERTRSRPVADARMSAAEGTTIALALALLGIAVLWIGSGVLSAIVAAATFISYAFLYTPLKRVTSVSTIIGAVPGALPPLIGWAAARDTVLEPGPWALFLIGFVWQLPHILAIGWMYRDDYARAGLPVLAAADPSGAMSGRQATLWSAALVPVSFLPSWPAIHLTGMLYVIGALVLGLLQVWLSFRFARERSNARARQLFYMTLLYLPLLWTLMALDRRVG